jgi:hypothetical protein
VRIGEDARVTAPAADPVRPPFGLLLDVDGPVASPVTRSISEPGLLDSLRTLAAAGVPIVFNTGRSDAFLQVEVVEPLLAAGFPAGARVHAVCEKGAVWFSITAAGAGEVHVDEHLAVPAAYGHAIERLVDERYGATMFFDRTKRAMVSVEQRLDVSAERYLAQRQAFDADALEAFADLGLGARWLEQVRPDAAGRVDYRVDPTIISTDLESVLLGKDRGAERALELLATDGPVPLAWRTVGDSRTDYAMADWLHAQGLEVAHVDVRPVDGVPATPYPVLAAQRSTNDAAGAAWLTRLVAVVRGEAADDAGFDDHLPQAAPGSLAADGERTR